MNDILFGVFLCWLLQGGGLIAYSFLDTRDEFTAIEVSVFQLLAILTYVGYDQLIR